VEVVDRALQLNPDDRYSTAREMRQALLDVLGYEPFVESNNAFASTRPCSD